MDTRPLENDWFHLQAIGRFIQLVGFPVAMCAVLSYGGYLGLLRLDAMAGDASRAHGQLVDMTRAMYAQADSTRELVNYLRGKDGLPPLAAAPSPADGR